MSKNTLETHLIHQLHAHVSKIMTMRLGNVLFSLVSIDVFNDKLIGKIYIYQMLKSVSSHFETPVHVLRLPTILQRLY